MPLSREAIRRISSSALLVLVFQLSLHTQSAPQQRISGISLSLAAANVLAWTKNSPPVNGFGGLTTLSDEHVTIFRPKKLFPTQKGYYFFAASRTNLNGFDSGLVVLDGGAGPDTNGTWYLKFAPGYTNGQVFLSPMKHHSCPASGFDATFDLNYAAPGTVLIDPTDAKSEALLMVYEGTNRCVQMSKQTGPFYATLGIATSSDSGKNWPTYAVNSSFVPPAQNPTFGPNAPVGAFGAAVCAGDCSDKPSHTDAYGRYAVLNPPGGIPIVPPFTQSMGDSEPSAFLDTVHRPYARPLLYVVHNTKPGGLPGTYQDSAMSQAPGFPVLARGLTIATAFLTGGKQRLAFQEWYNGSFRLQTFKYPKFCGGLQFPPCVVISNAGLGTDNGGLASPIFPVDKSKFANCQAGQDQTGGSISYVAQTHEYLLVFICGGLPYDPSNRANTGRGAAWFYSTLDAVKYDLSRQDQWLPPTEIAYSWCKYGPEGSCSTGWYPSFMSLNEEPGYLTTTGYVFSSAGSVNRVNGRQFVSHSFTISIK